MGDVILNSYEERTNVLVYSKVKASGLEQVRNSNDYYYLPYSINDTLLRTNIQIGDYIDRVYQ